MNPFDWYGPQFLAFYIFFAIAVLVLLRLSSRGLEGGDPDVRTGALTDPYRIALLRGGREEMVRVAAVSLIDRGLLSIDDGALQTTPLGRDTGVRRRLEEEILAACREMRAPAEIFSSREFDAVAFEYERELQRTGLLPDDALLARRRMLSMLAVTVLVLVAGIKIVIAIQRGRTNVMFLIIAAFIAVNIAASMKRRRTTARGDRLLDEARNLFQSLRTRTLQPGGATADVVMLAAIFGAHSVPFDWKHRLFPAEAASSGSSYDSSSSSSDSSSSSCGSSCGGGCGGGCGGCGS